MAQIFRLNTVGTKQGQFKGSSPRSNWTNATECHAFDYAVTAPFDANRGSYAGRRRHDPVTIVGQIDKATPQYWIALTTNEVLKTVKIDFFRPSQDGKETPYYGIVLTNATVVGARQFTEKDSTHSESTDTFESIELKFAFQKIDVTWVDGGVTGSDDWNTVV